jgi:hypothetical protein
LFRHRTSQPLWLATILPRRRRREFPEGHVEH